MGSEASRTTWRRSQRPSVLLLPAVLASASGSDASGSLRGGASSAEVQGPGAGAWPLVDPAEQGLDPELLRKAHAHVFESPQAATRDCLVVVKDGALVYEGYTSELYGETAHEGYSMSKSMGALLIGWAQTRGLLDIDADITEAYGVPSPRPYAVTTRQIMSQSVAAADAPGRGWQYDLAGMLWLHVLPAVFESATGRTPSAVWEEEFAKPLGLSDKFSWPQVDTSWSFGSRGTCRDYARIGQLMLNGGQWRGNAEPIVSADFVKEMCTPQRFGEGDTYPNPCYGMLTWLNTNPGSNRGSSRYPGVCQLWPEQAQLPAGTPSDVALLEGVLGQVTLVAPSLNLVMVTMGTTFDTGIVQRVLGEALCIMMPEECAAR